MATKVAGKFEPSALATPANAITGTRLLATPPVLVLIVHFGVSWVAVAAWVIVASTDFLDGWVARRQGATSSGAFLDPLADKVLVLGALAALASIGLASWVPVAIIGVREMAVSLYRSAVARNGVSVPARPLAKMKTAAQDLAVGFILLPSTGLHDRWVGESFLWVSVALALISGAQYLIDSRRTDGGRRPGPAPVKAAAEI
jgi:CDP-diacylglycerol--glycerol-3-phosphate 3-phosphatidyltransferase